MNAKKILNINFIILKFKGFVTFISILRPLYENFLPACFWFLNFAIFKKEIILELLIEINFIEAKNSFLRLLIVIMNNVLKVEEPYILEVIKLIFMK